jgi:processive 1,2-diacylglycerol beta-glucosyltransferase
MRQKKILLLSVSAGTGHTRAAEALRSYASASHLEVTAIHLDVMRFVTPRMRTLYTDCYIALVKRTPALWSYLYRITNEADPASRTHTLRRWVERVNSKPFLREIAEFNADIIICTHFLPAEILSHLIASGSVNCPVWVQVTDFDLHRMWVHEHIAGYFAPNEEVAFRMCAQGIAADAIHVTGIPIMPAFSQQLDRNICARELGIDPQVTTLLLMGGGAGRCSLHAIVERLLGFEGDFQLIALAGKNSAALTALQEIATRHPGRLVPLGYTDQIERLMACADLVVTKPGGLTVSECLAMGLPMILNAPIPGQEEHNANFLVEQGAAFKALDLATLEYRIRYLLAHPAKLKDMGCKAKALGRPSAAGQVLDTVLAKAEASPCN